jgi:esterase
MNAMYVNVVPSPGAAVMYHQSEGERCGRPLVLLHGLSADSSSWTPVVERFRDEWMAYALDFRGHGRSARAPGHYRLHDYVSDADRLLGLIGEPAILVGHSLGAVVAAVLAQDHHPLVAAVFLEDPPLYLVQPHRFAGSSFDRSFRVLREHVARLQAEDAPIAVYRELLAASPHPAGDRLGDHLHDDALWSRAAALACTDPEAIAAVLDGTTFGTYEPDRPIGCPAMIVRADTAYDPGFLPADENRLRISSPDVPVVAMPGAGHNIRGDRATRGPYLEALGGFLSGITGRLVNAAS